MKINTLTSRIALSAGLFFVSFTLGRLSWQYQEHLSTPPVQQINEINHRLPVLEIIDIKEAQVIGTSSTQDVRIVSGERVVLPDEEGNFTLDITHLGYIGPKRPVIEHKVPEWAQYVASKSGKYFYTLDEKQAKRLSVPNRIYFKSVEEALEAGYRER